MTHTPTILAIHAPTKSGPIRRLLSGLGKVVVVGSLLGVIAVLASFFVARSDLESALCRGSGFLDSVYVGRGAGLHCRAAVGDPRPLSYPDGWEWRQYRRMAVVLAAWATLRSPERMPPVQPAFPPRRG